MDNKRVTDHAKNLRKLKMIPDGLKIEVKPHGMYYDTDEFKEKWRTATNACCLIDHFERAQEEA